MDEDDPRLARLRDFYKAMYGWERLASRLDSLADNRHVGRDEADAEMRRCLAEIADEYLADFDLKGFVTDYSQPSGYDWDDVVEVYPDEHQGRDCLVTVHGRRYHPAEWWFPVVGDRFNGRFLNVDGRLVGKLL